MESIGRHGGTARHGACGGITVFFCVQLMAGAESLLSSEFMVVERVLCVERGRKESFI